MGLMNHNARILLVGSKGMLASAIAGALQRAGFATIIGVDVDTCDITSPDSVQSNFEKHQPNLVINCAAYTNVDGCESKPDLANAVNGTGVGNLAAASKRVGAKLIHYSTDYVFDGTMRRPLKPNDPVGPQSAYGRSKLLGEQLLQQHNPPGWMILRTAWLYGPNGPNFPQTMLNAARAGKPLKVVGDQFGAPTYTLDLAEATLNLLQSSGIFHVANAGQTNWFEFAQAIFEEFNVTPQSLLSITSDDWKKIKPDSAIRPAYSLFDLSDYTRATGRTLPHWRDALHRYRLLVG